MFVDTHVHIRDSQYDLDRKEVLQRAKEKGVHTLIEIGEDPLEWNKTRAVALEQRMDGQELYWTCGFHPHYAETAASFNFDTIKKEASGPLCVAIGEIGLDYFKSTASKEEQIFLFRKCLEAAADLNFPVVIHCREAQADMVRILKSFYGGSARPDLCPGVIHCFSGDRSFAELVLELGFYLGVDGPITYPNSHALREVIQNVPLEKIVLETDSPYLPPQGWRGKRNEPSYVAIVATKLAELFQVDIETVGQKTTENAKRVFKLK